MIKFHLFILLFISNPTKVPAWMDLPNLQETDTPFLVQIILEKKEGRERGRKRRKVEERKGGGGSVSQVMKFI